MTNFVFILLSLLLIFHIPFYELQQDNVPVDVHMEMTLINTKDYGMLRAIEIVIRNNSSNDIYIPGIRPFLLKISKKDNGKYVDFTNEWIKNELNIGDLELLDSLLGSKGSFGNIYDPTAHKFVDPTAVYLFNKLVLQNSKYSSDANYNLAIKNWVRDKFRGILFLKGKDTFKGIISITSLEEGNYYISFEYQPEVDLKKNYYPKEIYDSLNLEYPTKLETYSKWDDKLESGSLYLNFVIK